MKFERSEVQRLIAIRQSTDYSASKCVCVCGIKKRARGKTQSLLNEKEPGKKRNCQSHEPSQTSAEQAKKKLKAMKYDNLEKEFYNEFIDISFIIKTKKGEREREQICI